MAYMKTSSEIKKYTLAAIGKQIAICDAKYSFETRGAAIIFNKMRGFRNTPYRCQICNEWHSTSKGDTR